MQIHAEEWQFAKGHLSIQTLQKTFLCGSIRTAGSFQVMVGGEVTAPIIGVCLSLSKNAFLP